MIYRFDDAKTILESGSALGKMLGQVNSHDFVHLTIMRNKTLESHSMSVDVIFFVIQGTGVIVVDATEYQVDTGDMITVKSGLQRSWMNYSARDELKLLVIKSRT